MEFFVISIIKAAVVAFVLLTTLAYLQWVERKVIAHIQVRPGPYRVGPHGLLQPLADVVKLITKEDVLPPHVNKFAYLMAPFLAVTMALISISVIPFGDQFQAFGYTTWMQLTDLNVGLLFILAISSMGVYGVALAGWASNNKYALLGGLRSSAQMISYELPMSLAIAAPLLMVNTLSLREIVQKQGGYAFGFLPQWTIFQGPMPQIFSFFIFLIAAFAETNRVPFDLPEAENELVAGFHVEYSSMKFASFFMAEYANMVTVASLATILIFGWMAAAVSRVAGLRICRAGDFRAGRHRVLVPRAASGAAWRPEVAGGVRNHFSADRRGSADTRDLRQFHAAVLVRGQRPDFCCLCSCGSAARCRVSVMTS